MSLYHHSGTSVSSVPGPRGPRRQPLSRQAQNPTRAHPYRRPQNVPVASGSSSGTTSGPASATRSRSAHSLQRPSPLNVPLTYTNQPSLSPLSTTVPSPSAVTGFGELPQHGGMGTSDFAGSRCAFFETPQISLLRLSLASCHQPTRRQSRICRIFLWIFRLPRHLRPCHIGLEWLPRAQ